MIRRLSQLGLPARVAVACLSLIAVSGGAVALILIPSSESADPTPPMDTGIVTNSEGATAPPAAATTAPSLPPRSASPTPSALPSSGSPSASPSSTPPSARPTPKPTQTSTANAAPTTPRTPRATQTPPRTTAPAPTTRRSTTAPTTTAPRPSANGTGSAEQAIFSCINAQRTQRGLKALTWDSQATRVAELWSATMATQQNLYHNPNLGTLVTGWRVVGENVGYYSGGNAGANLCDAWMNSEGHRANILNPAFTSTGIGAVVDSRGYTYGTQVFKG